MMKWKVRQPKKPKTITDTWFAWYPIRRHEYWVWWERVLRCREYDKSWLPWYVSYSHLNNFPKDYKEVVERVI